ncbi:MAG: acetyl-CoA carboxylase biotin carboxyl carrier protein [Cryomorphaceae bacterium]|nr:acetyl-CoA carboxylase biotin carboxyl carrier protein [Cryomorphaceae bacterium]
MDIKEIQNLIRFVAKSGASEVKLETDDFKITIRTGSDEEVRTQYVAPQMMQPAQPVQSAPAPAAPAAPSPAPAAGESAEAATGNEIIIKSPMIGTIYRRPSPDKDVFVKVGDVIKPGDVVCIVEAMKLFNEIESEVSGKVVKVLFDDQSPVEYDQPLFVIEPA